jgi:hypothetical protein
MRAYYPLPTRRAPRRAGHARSPALEAPRPRRRARSWAGVFARSPLEGVRMSASGSHLRAGPRGPNGPRGPDSPGVGGFYGPRPPLGPAGLDTPGGIE